jgi:hypothetical protein
MLVPAPGRSVPAALLTVFCLLAAALVGSLFLYALLASSLSDGFAQIWQVFLRYLWIRGVIVDMSMLTTLISIWIYYRERHFGRALAAIALLWACGTAFFGIYIAFLWIRSKGSMETLLLGGPPKEPMR